MLVSINFSMRENVNNFRVLNLVSGTTESAQRILRHSTRSVNNLTILVPGVNARLLNVVIVLYFVIFLGEKITFMRDYFPLRLDYLIDIISIYR